MEREIEDSKLKEKKEDGCRLEIHTYDIEAARLV